MNKSIFPTDQDTLKKIPEWGLLCIRTWFAMHIVIKMTIYWARQTIIKAKVMDIKSKKYMRAVLQARLEYYKDISKGNKLLQFPILCTT